MASGGKSSPKEPVKLSDFKSIGGLTRLSAVDEWSKLDATNLETELDKHPWRRHFNREAVKKDITKWKQLTEQEKKKLLRQEKGSRRQGYQEHCSEHIQRWSQRKKQAEQRLRELEEKKASFQQKITGNLSDTHRRELGEMDEEIKGAKQDQEYWQKEIDVYKQALQNTSQEQDKESKQYLDEAMRRGYILASIIKCILTGCAGVGKTHLLCLLLGIKPPTVRCSTPCAKTPVRVVSGTRIQTVDGGWSEVGVEDLEEMLASYVPILCDTLSPVKQQKFLKQLVSSFKQLFTRTKQGKATLSKKKATPTSQDQPAPTSQDSASSTCQGQMISTSDAPKQAATSLLDDLVQRMNRLALVYGTEGSEESRDLSGSNWIHLIDSGGQPQFYDLLPLFIRHASIIVLVQRLCDRLDDYPIVEYYDQGESISTPYRYSLTNLENVMCLTRTMHSQPTDGKHSKIMIACTHRDMEGKCPETRDEKNKTLFDLLHPLFPNELVLYGDKPIFPVNTKEPNEEDERVAKLLRQAIESSAPELVKIPLWWYFLELALQRLAAMLGRRVLSRKECLSTADNFGFTKKEFDAALEYFDHLNICLYYPDILPNVVFSDPQVPLDKASELVQHSYRLREGSKSCGPQEALETKWLKFRDHGIIRPEFLEKFPNHYVDELFTPANLLQLFKHRLIFALLPVKDEYFMPSLLQRLPSEQLDKQRISSPDASPLLVHFPHGWPRSGIFCCLVVFLINHCKWQVVLPGTGSPILLARNCVKFRIPRSACTVTLIDSYANFEIHISAPQAVCRKICPTIRNLVFDGIDAAAITLQYNNSRPQVAFICAHTHSDISQTGSTKPSIPPHAAIITDDQEYWLCTRDADVHGELSEREKIWLPSETGIEAPLQHLGKLHSTPRMGDLMNAVAAKVPGKWREVAIGLGLDSTDISRIEADVPTHKSTPCYLAVFDTWKNKGAEDYTWDTLLKALRTPLVGARKLANTIESQLS